MELIVYDPKVREIISPDAELQKLATGFRFTEGPVLRDGALYFTDFYLDKVYRYEKGEAVLITDDSHRTIGMMLTKDGRLLGCASGIHAIMDMNSREVLADACEGIRFNGTNDLVEDRDGRIFFSDPYVREFEGPKRGSSAVFCMEKGVVTPVLTDLPWPNGVALSPDEKQLYIIDTRELRLYVMDRESGERRLMTQFSEDMGPGLPDGMCVREDGIIFLAGPGGISIIAPDGRILGLLKMPEVAANLCFDETGLFITASTSVYHIDLL